MHSPEKMGREKREDTSWRSGWGWREAMCLWSSEAHEAELFIGKELGCKAEGKLRTISNKLQRWRQKFRTLRG